MMLEKCWRKTNLAVDNRASLIIFHEVWLSLFLQIRSFQIIFVGATTDSHPIPVDGFDIWDTISNGAASPRTEALLNIDFPEKKPGLLLTYDTWYSGAAIRVGDMKLLMNVPNATRYQVPEEGGVPPDMDEIWVSIIAVFFLDFSEYWHNFEGYFGAICFI